MHSPRATSSAWAVASSAARSVGSVTSAPGTGQAWTGGRRSAHGAAASSCAATRISRSSRPKPATSWIPDGETVGGPVERQADRGLARDVALGRERHERGRPDEAGEGLLAGSTGTCRAGAGGSPRVGVSSRSKPSASSSAGVRPPPGGARPRPRPSPATTVRHERGSGDPAPHRGERPGEGLDVVLGDRSADLLGPVVDDVGALRRPDRAEPDHRVGVRPRRRERRLDVVPQSTRGAAP